MEIKFFSMQSEWIAKDGKKIFGGKLILVKSLIQNLTLNTM